MNLPFALLNVLIFPGLVYALPAGWLLLWLERKTAARLQGRIGPPFFQPFFDFIKLMAKRAPQRNWPDEWVLSGLPVLAVGSALGALSLLPVFASGTGFAGDLILLVALLELPAICSVLAGFASRSLFGQVGAAREAALSLAYNLPFLVAILALAQLGGSLRLVDLTAASGGWSVLGRSLAVSAIVLCLPAKLRLNPFSLANAEQEIYAGPLTEFGGRELALWELAHGLEWAALTGLAACLIMPRSGLWPIDGALFIVVSLLVGLLLAGLAAATARLKIAQAINFYWSWGFALAALALLVVNVVR